MLFIPDISGFTQFVNQTEVRHGQHIISELLELLIDANSMGMELAEIEGDALLFYKKNQLPSFSSIAEQARNMFLGFHSHLKKYQTRRICECGACRSAGELSLKFIVHSGPIEFIKVKDRLKPYGPAVILAHKLLKNDIDDSEYLLLTEPVLDHGNTQNRLAWLKLEHKQSHYEDIGLVGYHYGLLSDLHQEINHAQPFANPEKAPRTLVVNTFIEKSPEWVLETIIDFEQRMNWNKFAHDIQYQDKINRLGSKHVCVFDSGNLEFETVTNDFGDNSLVYGERVLTLPPVVREMIIYFIVTPKNGNSEVKLAVHYRLSNFIGWVFNPWFRYYTRRNNIKVLAHLKSWCERPIEAKTVPE